MSFSRHAFCDRCESKLVVDDEDELLENGWLTVAYGTDWNEKLDFCCLDCLTRWGGSAEAKTLLTEAAARSDEDDD